MSTISIFAGTYCQAEDVALKTAKKLNYTLINDQEVFSRASKRFNIPESRFEKVTHGKVSVFNKFTREQERCLAFLKLIIAEILQEEQTIICGRVARIIPAGISHVLSVCLIGDSEFRANNAAAEHEISIAQAEKIITRDDEDLTAWTSLVSELPLWDAKTYDILIPTDKENSDQATALIVDNAKKVVLLPTKDSMSALNDFLMQSHVETALVQEGHNILVSVKDSRVTLTINRQVLMLSKLEDELKRIAGGLSGVQSVEIKVGPDFHKADIYRKQDFEIPSKVLLVDDEQDFVQTLSDRLLLRDMGAAVAYDGQQALDFINEEEPEVMVLDLNMPGMDGMEVLRRVKKNHPNIEIIVLTGHGDQKVKDLCMDLGACAYLEKPADIDVLAEKMREANHRAKMNREA